MAGQGNYLAALTEGAKRVASALARAATTLAHAGWPVVKLVVRRAFEVLFALILIFEEWGWRPLAAWIARLARFPIVANVEAFIAGLPPYGALVAFAAPSILILPLKLLALYLIAAGHALSAALLFLGAKVAGTAILARLYMLTQPKLMQIGWFARAHDWFMPWKDRMFAAIRASWAWRYARIVKYRVGQAVRARWIELRPTLMAYKTRIAEQARDVLGRVRAWISRRSL
jgi:hypothetical protein